MKQCPQCGKLYPDDDLNFCLDDGTALLQTLNTSEEETVVLPSPRSSTLRPVARQGVSPVFAYLAIGLIALIAGGGIVAWMMSGEASPAITGNSTASRGDSSPETRPQNSSSDTQSNNTNRAITSPSPKASPIDTTEARTEVQGALNGWLQSLTEKDLDTRMSFYADRLDAYYTKRNVPVSSVRSENLKVFERYSTLDMDITNLDVVVDERSGDVTTTFDKTFDFQDEERVFSGAVRSEFRWRKIGGRWKIVSERDLKVY